MSCRNPRWWRPRIIEGGNVAVVTGRPISAAGRANGGTFMNERRVSDPRSIIRDQQQSIGDVPVVVLAAASKEIALTAHISAIFRHFIASSRICV